MSKLFQKHVFLIVNLKCMLQTIFKQNDFIKQKILDFQNQVEAKICSDLPNAFWDRKQHMVDLPYESDFDERNIPTKQDLSK